MENALILAGIDMTSLTEEQKAELAQVMNNELEISRTGMTLRPTRIKINKDSCSFVDPFGRTLDELKGVVIYKQKTRGLWEKGNNMPLCSSIDGITGMSAEKEKRLCANCQFDAWGSGRDENGNPTKGKACKEMRRAFILLNGGFLPVVVTFPPTSLGAYDEYFSARIADGIPDIAAETIFRLVPQKSGAGFSYAQVQCKMGAKVAGADILRYSKLRNDIKAFAESMDVEGDEYMQGNDSSETVDPFATA